MRLIDAKWIIVEGQADRRRREGRVLVARVGDGEDHVDEDRGHDDLDQERRPPGVAGAVVAEEVLGQARLADVVAVDALDQDEQREAGDDGAARTARRRTVGTWRQAIRPPSAAPTDTAGLKWAPEIRPNA